MRTVFLIMSIFLGMAVSASAEKTPQKMTALSEAETKTESIWIDVRTPEEFNEGHLQGAINIPFEQIVGKIAEVAPNKNTQIHLYCRSGRRAEIALQELTKQGYINVINHGAYQDLKAK